MPQPSTPIAISIAYWPLEMKRREAGDDPRNIFRKATIELRQLLKIDATEHPELKDAGQKAVAAALKTMAEECGMSPDEAQAIIDSPEPDPDIDNEDGQNTGRARKQSDILIALAQTASLFHTPAPDSDAFADIMIGGHRETHRIRLKGFREWLRHQYFKLTNSGCNFDAMQVAIETIAAKAQYEGDARTVHVRVADHGGDIYIDIGDPEWRAIKVTASGWEVVKDVPVRFVRSKSTKALPIPQRGGSIALLKPFCNLKTDKEFVRLVAHILAVMRPNANYPVLVMTGEQGSCKSTLFRLIVRLTDPRSPEQRSLPDSEDNLITAAKGAHVLPFDNISGMPGWLSDSFCRLATGGGAGKRRLYTDDDEILFEGRRPVFLNGIEEVVTRADLVDRANIFTAEPITESNRRTEAEIDADFAAEAPKILGALLDGLVAGLRNLPTIKMADKPRMADFVLWGEACTRAYWPVNTFTKAYRDGLAASVELVIEASAVGSAVRLFMDRNESWEGTAQDLLSLLDVVVGEKAAKERGWPRRPNTLSGKLTRAAPDLRKIGISITRARREGDGSRIIRIEKSAKPDQRPKSSSGSSASSAHPTASNKTNSLVKNGADDPLTITDDATVSTNSLNKRPSDDADNADDESPLCSEADMIHTLCGDPATADADGRCEPGLRQVFASVRIREIRHPAISAGPHDRLDDFVV